MKVVVVGFAFLFLSVGTVATASELTFGDSPIGLLEEVSTGPTSRAAELQVPSAFTAREARDNWLIESLRSVIYHGVAPIEPHKWVHGIQEGGYEHFSAIAQTIRATDKLGIVHRKVDVKFRPIEGLFAGRFKQINLTMLISDMEPNRAALGKLLETTRTTNPRKLLHAAGFDVELFPSMYRDFVPAAAAAFCGLMSPFATVRTQPRVEGDRTCVRVDQTLKIISADERLTKSSESTSVAVRIPGIRDFLPLRYETHATPDGHRFTRWLGAPRHQKAPLKSTADLLPVIADWHITNVKRPPPKWRGHDGSH